MLSSHGGGWGEWSCYDDHDRCPLQGTLPTGLFLGLSVGLTVIWFENRLLGWSGGKVLPPEWHFSVREGGRRKKWEYPNKISDGGTFKQVSHPDIVQRRDLNPECDNQSVFSNKFDNSHSIHLQWPTQQHVREVQWYASRDWLLGSPR